MSARAQASLRIARRAYAGASALPVVDRIQLYDDLALILPEQEAKLCRDAAFYLKETGKLQLSLDTIFA